MNRTARILAFTTGTLLFASGLAHALVGWPQLAPVLVSASVPAETIAAMAVGWYFGSVSMLSFGAMAVSFALLRSPSAAVPLGIIAVAYTAFGSAAYILRNFNPHFLGFIAIGLLAATGALFARRA